MKILMLNYEYPPIGGGASNAVHYVLKEMSRMDVEIDLITSSADEYKIEDLGNVRIHKLDVGKSGIHHWNKRELSRYSWLGYRLAKKLSIENDYDICHAWFAWPCGVIARRLGIPYIVSLRGSDVPGFNHRLAYSEFFLTPITRWACSHAERVIANSSGLKALARQSIGSRINIIPNGVDSIEFSPSNKTSGRLRILCVSRLINRKRIDLLIHAASYFDAQYCIVGTGKEEKNLKKLALDLGVSERIEFPGYVPHDEIHKYYAESDVFVLLSENEGMSNTMLEAMASGLGIIMTDVGGADMLKGAGMIIDADVEELVRSLKKMSGQTLTGYGRLARQRSESLDWKGVAVQYMEEYKCIMQKP